MENQNQFLFDLTQHEGNLDASAMQFLQKEFQSLAEKLRSDFLKIDKRVKDLEEKTPQLHRPTSFESKVGLDELEARLKDFDLLRLQPLERRMSLLEIELARQKSFVNGVFESIQSYEKGKEKHELMQALFRGKGLDLQNCISCGKPEVLNVETDMPV